MACSDPIFFLLIETNQTHFYYNLILPDFFYMFRAKKFHHQDVSCRIQALWCNRNVTLYHNACILQTGFLMKDFHGPKYIGVL